MGRIYEEFKRELAGVRRKYAGRPRREIAHLLLLALEREELVSVAYREALILRRLARMPIEHEVRELIRHALVWAWKDEEMHALYIRGGIRKLGPPALQARALLRELAGAVAGWASSVQQHDRWRDAPISRAAATIVTWVGLVMGQVPEDVRHHLKYGPFRDFCTFNEEAERTAWLCYHRLLEILDRLPNVPPTLVEDFRRVQADEERHRRVFEALAGVLDEQDRLVPGANAASLARTLGEIGAVFLPGRRADGAIDAAESLIGSGGPVWVVRGSAAGEKIVLFRRLLDQSGLADRLERRGRALGKPVADLRVAIKPAFMLGYHRGDVSTITDPALLDELVSYLRDRGCRDVAVAEARNLYDRFYRNRGVRDVARYLGIDPPGARIVDLSEEQVPHAYTRGMAQYSVARTWQEADFRISFGKLRSHPVDIVYLTVGNLDSIGARCDEYLFAERQAERTTATMMLAGEFPPHFALLDAYDVAADGMVGIIGCPRPPTPRRLYAGPDALAVDLVAARHTGLADPRSSIMLRAACYWFGDPSERLCVVGPDEPIAHWRSPRRNPWTTLLSWLAYPMYELGSGRGALFVPEIDERAFPPIRRTGPALRIARRAAQTLVGLRHSP